MKLIANIPGIIKMLTSLKPLQPFKKEIILAKASGDVVEERKWILKSSSTWGKYVMDAFGSELNVKGYENIPKNGPVVFVGNHQGYADIFAYCAILTNFQFAFIAKKELFKIPIYGKWIERIRSVAIERDDPRAALEAISKGIGYIEQGFSMVIFPEGTRSKGPTPGAFQKGSLKLATKPGVPIIPISLDGTYNMFEDTGVIKGAKINVIIHKPISTKGISRKEEKQLAIDVEKIITDGVNMLNQYRDKIM